MHKTSPWHTGLSAPQNPSVTCQCGNLSNGFTLSPPFEYSGITLTAIFYFLTSFTRVSYMHYCGREVCRAFSCDLTWLDLTWIELNNYSPGISLTVQTWFQFSSFASQFYQLKTMKKKLKVLKAEVTSISPCFFFLVSFENFSFLVSFWKQQEK